MSRKRPRVSPGTALNSLHFKGSIHEAPGLSQCPCVIDAQPTKRNCRVRNSCCRVRSRKYRIARCRLSLCGLSSKTCCLVCLTWNCTTKARMVLARQSSVLSARKFLIPESARVRRRIFRFVNNLHRKTTVRASLIWSPSSSKKGGRYGFRLSLGMVRGSLSRNGEGGSAGSDSPLRLSFFYTTVTGGSSITVKFITSRIVMMNYCLLGY